MKIEELLKAGYINERTTFTITNGKQGLQKNKLRHGEVWLVEAWRGLARRVKPRQGNE